MKTRDLGAGQTNIFSPNLSSDIFCSVVPNGIAPLELISLYVISHCTILSMLKRIVTDLRREAIDAAGLTAYHTGQDFLDSSCTGSNLALKPSTRENRAITYIKAAYIKRFEK